MLEPAEMRRKNESVDRNGLAEKNTGSLKAAESEEWNYQEYSGAGGNNNWQNPEKKTYMILFMWKGWKIIDSHIR